MVRPNGATTETLSRIRALLKGGEHSQSIARRLGVDESVVIDVRRSLKPGRYFMDELIEYPDSRLDEHSTDAGLGSEARIEALARRARQGVSLFHPLDAMPDLS